MTIIPGIVFEAADDDVSVDGDRDHAHEGGGHVAVEQEGEHPTQLGTQDPLLVEISHCCQGKVEATEQQI